jgi:hypothetical protein
MKTWGPRRSFIRCRTKFCASSRTCRTANNCRFFLQAAPRPAKAMCATPCIQWVFIEWHGACLYMVKNHHNVGEHHVSWPSIFVCGICQSVLCPRFSGHIAGPTDATSACFRAFVCSIFADFAGRARPLDRARPRVALAAGISPGNEYLAGARAVSRAIHLPSARHKIAASCALWVSTLPSRHARQPHRP